MKKFLLNSLAIASPFLMYMILIAVVDPFNYLNLSDNEDIPKLRIAKEVEPHLFQMIAYQNHPKKNIVLGDSRSDGLYAQLNSRYWSNLSFGGGSLKEVIQTFWWVTEKERIDSVLIGINFNLYNKFNKRFWVEETIERNKNFVNYAFSRYTFQSTISLFRYYVLNEENILDKPHFTKEEFWQYQINNAATKFFERYGYPESYFNELKNISTYCANHDIKLIFWIPPTHIEFQQRIKDFNLQEEYKIFVSDLRKLGDLYDFNYVSDLTTKKENFKDPLHFSNEKGKAIYTEIFSGSPYYSKFYANDLSHQK